MLRIIKNKAGSSPIPIVFLIIGIMVATSTALMTFYNEKSSIEEQLSPIGTMNEIYNKEEQIRFYIDYIVTEAIKEGNNEEKIKESVEKSLELGKQAIIELEQIIPQLENGIVVNDRLVTTFFTVKLEQTIMLEGEEKAKQEHYFTIAREYETFINKNEVSN
jgi:hypothetical protein